MVLTVLSFLQVNERWDLYLFPLLLRKERFVLLSSNLTAQNDKLRRRTQTSDSMLISEESFPSLLSFRPIRQAYPGVSVMHYQYRQERVKMQVRGWAAACKELKGKSRGGCTFWKPAVSNVLLGQQSVKGEPWPGQARRQ